MQQESKILSLESVSIGFESGGIKNILLPPLNCSAEIGELVSIIGRNGIGKSTLMRTMAGLQAAINGNVFYSGKEIGNYSGPELATHTGYISTEIIKVSNMTVYDLVSLGRYPYTNWYGNLSVEDKEKIAEALQKTSIERFSGRFVAELSDGERQKAMIARMLAQDTRVMLMDEPTAFLDIESRFSILHLLHQLSHDEGKTIIFTTHDLHLALGHSDKMWLMLDNGLVEGAPEDLLLAGKFDLLFSSSAVQFNSKNGTYSLKVKKKGSISIEGEGNIRHWTREAVKRAGYSVTETKSIPYIIAQENNWILVTLTGQKKYNSIYDLIRGITESYL